MSFRGEQVNKSNGVTYIYEARSVWNPKKQRSEQKRIYIGKKDPETGELIPNKTYYRIYGSDAHMANAKTRDDTPKTVEVMSSHDYGNIAIMQHAADDSGLTGILKECFPDRCDDILACAMHCCSENEPLYLCKLWAENSYGTTAPASQRISELLRELDEDSRMNFYRKWAALRSEKEYLALDITSISSWSDLINFVEPRYNRDHEQLPQINLAMLFGEDSKLPVFPRVYPGSIHDVSTLLGMATFIQQIKLDQMHFVMDKGFYSLKGITPLLENYIKFAIGVPFSTDKAKELVDLNRDSIDNAGNAIMIGDSIYYSVTHTEMLRNRRVHYHVYYDEQKHTDDRRHLMQKVISYENELQEGTLKMSAPVAKHYFTFQKTKDGSYNIHRRTDVIESEKKYAGYFVILTNHYKDPQQVLEIYRNKDVVEKSFNNLKNDLDLERLRIHTDEAMQGRIFIGFISLILMSYIREKMRIHNIYSKFTYNELIAELKKLKVIIFKGGRKLMTEVTKNQKLIFDALEMKVPELS